MSDLQSIFTTHHSPGRTVQTDRGEFLFFSGTAYLGMPLDARFHQHLLEGIGQYGSNYGSSRTSNLRLKVFEETESYLAHFAGSEAAVTMSSGYMAGQLVAQWLFQQYAVNPGARVLYAPQTHPAVWLPGAVLPETTFEHWTEQVVAWINDDTHHETFIVIANAVDSLLGRIHHFHWLKDIDSERNVLLVVDDSHGFGVTGSDGNGVYSLLPDLPNVQKIVVASMGKALGLPAGVVFSSVEVIEKLKMTGFYSGGSPAPPAYLYAFLKSKQIYHHNLVQLKKNIRHFSSHLPKHTPQHMGSAHAHEHLFNYSAGYPVFFTRQNTLYPFLLKKGILLSSFAYPKASGTIVTRVVINALHTEEDMDTLLEGISQFSG